MSKVVQIKNPVTQRWVKLNTETGSIICHKASKGPFKRVPKYSNKTLVGQEGIWTRSGADRC